MSGFAINHTETSQVDDQTLEAHMQSLAEYRDRLSSIADSDAYNEPESALRLSADNEQMEPVVRVAGELSQQTNPKYVVVIGMGGSVRGTKAVYDLTRTQTGASMLFLDSVTAKGVSDIANTLASNCSQPEEFAICVVSKSGTTTETIANTSVLIQQLSDAFDRDRIMDRMVAITDRDSQLDQLAQDRDVRRVHIPEQVGGRFSVLSAVGLLPLLLAGLDVRELTAGADSILEASLSGRVESDPAAAVAAILFEHSQSARRIINHFFFTPRARNLGSWASQLFAESLGKQRNRQGEPTYSGLYPTTTIGPNDLHSLYQLQLGGPKNFVSLIVRELNTEAGDLSAQVDDGFLVADLEHINGKRLGDIQTALGQAVTESFAEAGRPFVEITVPELNLERIGQFMLLEELVVMYLADLMNVNAFNQPQVETYKDTTRDLLTANS